MSGAGKNPLDLSRQWSVIIGGEDSEPRQLEIVKGTVTKAPKLCPMTSRHEFAAMSDKDLEIAIKRQESSIGIMSSRLPDKGEKFKTRLKTLEDERERRRLRSLDKKQELVLVDEDDPQLVETIEQPKEISECVKVDKIHYPSRDHPESVEIAYEDINCLSLTAFLNSPIMNFYIRYIQLQAPPTNKATCDYHFFNTFFYKKLEQAVKRSDKETHFVKFRRWWKGVNIFQKAYLLIPIHDDFLREEWEYMKDGVTSSDLPIADRIWKSLPRRIDEQVIPVPQQKNDFDCGLFVLFFMERFIEEAHERLKKKDLQMFGKGWFRPEEASSLRGKIQNLLMDKF